MDRAGVYSSPYGTPGEVVAVEDGQVVWAGPISALEKAGRFDALFCHEDDEERLNGLLRGAGNKQQGRAQARSVKVESKARRAKAAST